MMCPHLILIYSTKHSEKYTVKKTKNNWDTEFRLNLGKTLCLSLSCPPLHPLISERSLVKRLLKLKVPLPSNCTQLKYSAHMFTVKLLCYRVKLQFTVKNTMFLSTEHLSCCNKPLAPLKTHHSVPLTDELLSICYGFAAPSMETSDHTI